MKCIHNAKEYTDLINKIVNLIVKELTRIYTFILVQEQ